MRSTMTERQFRIRLLTAGINLVSEASDAAVAAAREAGLEFAPEPVRLPDTFMLKEVGGSALILVDTQVNGQLGLREAEEVCRRAMLYPHLRTAAQLLMSSVGAILPANMRETNLRRAYENLDAELAKGEP